MNNHQLSGLISLVLSLAIAGVAGVFSVTGLGEMFSAAFWPVVAMGVVLEAGKLRAAAWLHGNWENPKAGRLLRAYMLCAVGSLMLVNGIGIYGFLSRAYLGQSDGDGATQAQIIEINAQIAADQTVIDIAQADVVQKSGLERDYRAKGWLVSAGRQIAAQVPDQQRIEAAMADIAAKQAAELPLKDALSKTDSRLGPMKYVAEAMGWSDPDAAVRVVIGLIMMAFDPLAIVLLLASTISFAKAEVKPKPGAKRAKKAHGGRRLSAPLPAVVPTLEVAPPVKTARLYNIHAPNQLDLFGTIAA